MKHNELTDLACRWLKRGSNPKHQDRSGPACALAFSEVKAGHSGEIADAIGFRTGAGMETVLVEVKTSRSDFLADFKKPHRNGQRDGIGNYRYYLCPEGLIQPRELPEGWGLLWVAGGRRVIVAKVGHVLRRNRTQDNHWFNSDRDAELALLTWLMVKVGDPKKLVDDRKRLTRENSRLARLADDRDRQNRELRNKLHSARMAKEQEC